MLYCLGGLQNSSWVSDVLSAGPPARRALQFGHFMKVIRSGGDPSQADTEEFEDHIRERTE
jgi:hypothetical protein